MNIGDIVSALLPSLLMFFAVSLGANSLERAVQNFARNRFEIGRLTGEAEAVRARMGEIRGEYETLKRSEEHTSELQSLMRKSYAVFCLKKTKNQLNNNTNNNKRI